MNEIQELRFLVGEAWKGSYNPNTEYGNANVVQDSTGLSVYRSKKPGNVGHPLTDTDWWFCIIDLSGIKSESDRIAALNNAIASDEELRVAAENSRKAAETSRRDAENIRVENESERISSESERKQSETTRVNNENDRQGNEQTRQSNEQTRQSNEQTRQENETDRQSDETQRTLNEQNRVSAEEARVTQYGQDHSTAVSDHETAVQDHAQMTTLVQRADNDHENITTALQIAASDHSQAASDHTTAAGDHTTAEADHITATGDHTTAAGDHTTAEADHAQAVEDHQLIVDMDETYLKRGEYDASTAVGLADNIRGDVYADEQFAVRMTGGEANEVGGIGVVQQLKGAGAAIVQMFPEGAGHDFSGDVSLDGTGGNAEAPVRYSDLAGTVEMGYLLVMEAFISQTLSQAQLDAISAKDTGKQDRDKAVWLTPAGAITSAPTIESGQTEVTFSGWRIAMRVKASEVRDSSASTYWFTAGTAGRQVYDVAVAEGVDDLGSAYGDYRYVLANGWNTGSAMEYLQHMAAQGLPTHSVKAMSALLSVTKIGIKTVKSRNLLNPQTGRALLKAYVNDDESFEDNEYTMLGGLPSGSTMAFTSLLTGKTETLTMLDATHFVIPSDGWLQITGTLPTSIICTWGGEKDNTAADEYATESHVWDVTQLFGTKDGGTEGHYYRFAKEGMRGAGSAQDVVELVGARGEVKVGKYTFTNSNTWQGNNDADGWRCLNVLTGVGPTNSPSKISKCNGRWNIVNGTSYRQGISVVRIGASTTTEARDIMAGADLFYALASASYITFTSLFLSASSTSDELTQMPADAIPLSEIQFADNNWSIEEAVYDAPEADANGVITPTAVTGQMRIQYSLDAAEQIDTLQKEYQALEARVTALENA